MQTQTEAKTERPIEQQIEQAEAQLEKLKSAAEEATAEAQRWQLTFEREPTDQAFTARAVAEQRATNANAAAATHETDVLGPLIQRKNSDELARLAAEGETYRAAVLVSFDEATDALIAAAKAFDSAIAKLAGYHKMQVRCNAQPLSLERICSTIQTQFGAIREAGEYQQHARMTRDARIRFANVGGVSHFVEIELVRPATAVPSAFR